MSTDPERVPLPEGDLSLSLLAERISHERALRVEQRRTDQQALDAAKSVIEERLQVLNGERQRQNQDRQSFVTRPEYDTAHTALEAKVEALSVTMTTEIRALRESRERDLGRQSGTQGIQSWLAPSLPAIVALVATGVALYLALSGD